MPSRRIFKYLALSGLLILVALIYSQQINFTSIDLGRHLENGREIWQDRQLLHQNFYSYTEPDFPFINHHWLYGVIVYGLYLISGFGGLSAFNALLAIAAFFIFFRLAKERAGFYPAAILALPVILLLSERVEIRPEIVSYLLVAICFYILDRVSLSSRYRLLWILPPLFFLWVNIHIYFFIGLAVLAFSGLSDLKHWRQRFFPYLAVIGACLLNPNTWKGLIYPLNIFENYGYEVAENKSVFFLQNLMVDANFLIFKIVLALLALSWLAYYLHTKRLRAFDSLVSLFFAGLALFSSRNISLFGLVALPIVAANLAPLIKRSSWLKGRHMVIVLFLGLAACFVWVVRDSQGAHRLMRQPLGWGVSSGYDASFRFFQDKGLSGPVFNNYDIGSALIFWFAGQEKVFVDNRPEAYSAAFFQNTYRPMQEDPAAWDRAREEYGIATIYFSHTDGTPWANAFLARILSDDSWRLLYFDAKSVILSSRQDQASDVIDEAAFAARYRELQATGSESERMSLASLAETIGYPELVAETYTQIIEDNPRSYRGYLGLAGLYSSSADQSYLRQAVVLYGQVLERGFRLPLIYNRLGLVHWQLGEYALAKRDWEAAQRRNRKDEESSSYLLQLQDLQRAGQLPPNLY